MADACKKAGVKHVYSELEKVKDITERECMPTFQW